MKKTDDWTVKLSPKGQIVLPKDLRDKRGWKPGAEFVVEERPDGVLLRLNAERVKVTLDEVAGCLGPVDRSRTVEDMEEAIRRDIQGRWKEKSSDRD